MKPEDKDADENPGAAPPDAAPGRAERIPTQVWEQDPQVLSGAHLAADGKAYKVTPPAGQPSTATPRTAAPPTVARDMPAAIPAATMEVDPLVRVPVAPPRGRAAVAWLPWVVAAIATLVAIIALIAR